MLTNAYCTLEQLREEIGGGALRDDPTRDTQLERAINAASRQIDRYTGRRFWQDASVKTREYEADSPWCCFTDDISTTTGLIVAVDTDANGTFETTLTVATDFTLYPLNDDDDNPVEPFTEIRLTDNYQFPVFRNGRPGVRVTAKFGWPAVPDEVVQATLLQAGLLHKAKDAAFGVVTFGSGGAESLAMRLRSSLNPVAQNLVAPFRIPAVG